MEYMIPACSGKKVEVKQGQTIMVIDLEGGQVVDFFAEATGNQNEFLSPGVTIDCNVRWKGIFCLPRQSFVCQGNRDKTVQGGIAGQSGTCIVK